MRKLKTFITLTPEYRPYVWGGERLRPGYAPTAEAWVVYEGNSIATGDLAGRTLAEAAQEFGTALLGAAALRRSGLRFPLLIKLLDCNQWLSLQVHPDDAMAAILEGPGQLGKTEAWHVLDADEHALLIAGFTTGVLPQDAIQAIHNGRVIDWVEYLPVSRGDTIFMPAGTIHALGPGLLIYEVQQTSDLTYRVYDWDRPATSERPLHLDKATQVMKLDSRPRPKPEPELAAGQAQFLVENEYFKLELLAAGQGWSEFDTAGETFHALTVIEGTVELRVGGQVIEAGKSESLLAPAELGAYHVRSSENGRLLKASL